MIQIVNRNLLLILSGQERAVTPFEFRKLQRVDAGVFGNDKFAFEMVHFVKSDVENNAPESSLLHKWGKCLSTGLESLLVECAVIRDDIERDCFVSRVYCWFTERLAERKDIPRPKILGALSYMKKAYTDVLLLIFVCCRNVASRHTERVNER